MSSCLAKPIVAIADASEISKHLSPYFMRRTFQDLCRAAHVHDFVARAISGHATIEMQQLGTPKRTAVIVVVIDSRKPLPTTIQ